MKRAMLYNPKDLRVEEVDIPTITDDEILVKNKISLTCGTDVKNYFRGYPLLTPPHPFGHEFAGEIIKVGNNVSNFKVGDRIVAHNTAPCNKCYYCKKGQNSLCESLVFNRGTYAEYVKVPKEIVEQNTFKIPEDMDYKTAALLEPFACAVYGIDQVDIRQGDTVAIIGAGPIGLMFVKLAYLKGAKVIVSDLSKYRLSVAEKLGAHITILSDDNLELNIKQETPNSRGVDVLIEATGVISIWNRSLSFVRKGGEVLLFGGTAKETTLELDANKLHYDQIVVKGVFHTTPVHVDKAMELLKLNVIDGETFVQNEYTIDQVEDALLEHHSQEVIKNCIIYND